jgi:hypothetical protein
MDKDHFVIKLKDFTPSREVYDKLGLSEAFIAKVIRSHQCVPFSELRFNPEPNNEIFKLLSSYDCSTVEIGVLTFNNEVSEVGNYYIIGNVEADLLALNRITLEIQVLDYLVPSHVIWDCAANGERLLDALALCAEHFFKIHHNSALSENASFIHEHVLQCAEKAGGEKYVDFYKLLLGDE